MEIDDYKKADCTKFRAPAVDFSLASKDIEYAILQAWRNGASADAALERILDDERILNPLMDQVQKNLEYQQKTGLQNVEAKAAEELSDYERRMKDALQYVEETLGAKAEEKKNALAETRKTLDEKRFAYNSSRARLEEMRARVKAKIGEVGGEERYKTIVEAAQETFGQAGIAATSQPTPPGPVPTPPTPQEPLQAETPTTKKGFFRKVWDVLNYKLW